MTYHFGILFLPLYLFQCVNGNNFVNISDNTFQTIINTAPTVQLPKYWFCPQNYVKLQCCTDCFCSSNEIKYCQEYLNRTKRSPYGCVSARLNDIDIAMSAHGPYLMKSGCSDNANTMEIEMCSGSKYTRHDLLAYIPVTGSDSVTYRNQYCADCNNVTKYAHWKPELKCIKPDPVPEIISTDQLVRELLTSDNCNIYFTPLNESGTPEKCSITSGCIERTIHPNISDDHTLAQCSLHASIFHKQDNIICLYCNGRDTDDTDGFGDTDGSGSGSAPSEMIGTVSFTALLNIIPISRKPFSTLEEKTVSCSGNQIHDSYTGSCIDVSCTKPLVYNEGICIDVYKSTEWFGGENYVQLIKVNFIMETKGAQQHLITEINNAIDAELEKKISYLNSLEMSRKSVLGDYCRFSHFCFILQDHDHVELNINQNFFIKAVACDVFGQQDYRYTVENLLLHLSDRQNVTVINGTHINLKYSIYNKPHRPYFHLRKFATCLSSRDKNEYIRIHPTSLCPNVNLTKSEFSLIYKNEEICFENVEHFCLSPEEYLDLETSIVICVDDFKTFGMLYANFSMNMTTDSNENIPVSADGWLSFICTILSLLCLFVSLLTYCLFKQLRTLPGKNNMCLMLYLMLAHALYQFGMSRTELGTGCIILGFLTHLFWLMTFGMQTICCIHVFRCFVSEFSVSASNISKNTKMLIVYNFIAFLYTTVFVSLNIVLAKTSSSDVGYGGKICYISQPQRILFTFAVPLGICILTNICLIVAVIIKLQRMPDIKRHVKNERNNMKIYAKLSTITGFTWIFGFLFAWTANVVFSYLFILFTALQGVFLMCAFVLNARVMNMYKSLFYKYRDDSSNTKISTVSVTK